MSRTYFTVEFNCKDRQQQRDLQDQLYELFPLGLFTEKTAAISSCEDGPLIDRGEIMKNQIETTIQLTNYMLGRQESGRQGGES